MSKEVRALQTRERITEPKKIKNKETKKPHTPIIRVALTPLTLTHPHSRNLQNRSLQDPKRRVILRELRPPHHLPPIHRIRLLLPRARERPHLVLRQPPEDEEQTREDAGFGGDGHVDCRRDFGGAEEAVGDVLVLGEGVDVGAVALVRKNVSRLIKGVLGPKKRGVLDEIGPCVDRQTELV